MTMPGALTTALADRYRLERELGAGGMATVYLAEDAKHHRQVAIKVLRPELAALLGAERFLNEIEVTAHLHHPHILPLFDSGQADSFLYYVMPYIEGESLRDRLTREKQLPVADALRIAAELASALDYAHRHGVIHRDIKPENILLHDGQALVADFGIALAVTQAGGHRLTETGLSLGTPHYMSPEQGAGDRALDARSDVYSLGAVLYELLAGEPPYTGSTLQAITARKLSDTMPSLRTVREQVPEAVEAAIRKALARTPADRFSSAAAFRDALVMAQARPTVEVGTSERRRRPAVQAALVSAVLIAGVLAGLFGAWFLWPSSPADDELVRRTSIILPDSIPLAYVGEAPLRVGRRSLALSPDGSTLVYVGWYRGRTHLFVRPLDQARVRRLEGTEGAYSPFFSPNGKWVGFFASSALKKAPLDGGAPVELASAPETYGGVWLPDGRILFAKDEGTSPTIVNENGGAAAPAGAISRLTSPALLPGTDGFVAERGDGLVVASMSDSVPLRWGPSGFMRTPRRVAPSPSASPQLLRGDYLIVAGDGRLHALPFSLSSLQALGPLVPLDEQVRQETFGSAAQFAIGGEGTLVYAPGADVARSVLIIADRRGRIDTLPFEKAVYLNPAFSPDGRRVAVSVRVARGYELQLLDLATGSRLILLTSPTVIGELLWPADGKRILYQDSTNSEMEVLASGGAPRQAELRGWLEGVSGDGAFRVVREGASAPYLSGPGQGKAPLPRSAFMASFSHDNKWVIWNDIGTRQYEIFLSAVPLGGPIYSMTPEGGFEGYWMPDSREIVCLRSDGYLYAVPLTFEDGEVRGGQPRRLTSVRALDTPGRTWALSPDGQRMLFVLSPPGDSATVLTVVTNFRRVVEHKLAEARGQAPP